jgi:hypothetical protein
MSDDNTKNGVRYGCHVDLLDGEEPDGCGVDFGAYEDCTYGTYKDGKPRRTKWTCKYWRPVSAALQPATDSEAK